MKIKTITKCIDKKMSEWISSIEDESLRKEVREGLIVTGGCIASLLLKEQVNDYDIYFKNKSVLLKISQYYVSRVAKIYKNNISDSKIEVVDSKSIPTKDYVEDGNDYNKWSFFVKGLQKNDEDRVKIYIPHIGYWRRSDDVQGENQEELNYEPVYLSENAISLSKDVQLVVRFFGDAKEIHTNYDFIHATNYFHYKDGKPKLVCNIGHCNPCLQKS